MNSINVVWRQETGQYTVFRAGEFADKEPFESANYDRSLEYALRLSHAYDLRIRYFEERLKQLSGEAFERLHA